MGLVPQLMTQIVSTAAAVCVVQHESDSEYKPHRLRRRDSSQKAFPRGALSEEIEWDKEEIEEVDVIDEEIEIVALPKPAHVSTQEADKPPDDLEVPRRRSSMMVAKHKEQKCHQCPVDPSDRSHASKCKKLQQLVHFTVDHPTYSVGSRVWNVLVIGAIITSSVTSIGSSSSDWNDDIVTIIEEAVAAVLTLEVVGRIISVKSRVVLSKNWLTWIDVLAILPFYLNLFLSQELGSVQALQILRILRVLRVLRLLKLGRYMKFLKVFSVTIQRSFEAILLLFFFIVLLSIIFGTLISIIEQGTFDQESGNYLRSDGSISPFQSIPAGMYWSITTLTTVGYGDLTPVEPAGRAIANIVMVTGLIIFALPLAVVGSNFQAAFESYRMNEESKKRKKDRKTVVVQEDLDAINETFAELEKKFVDLQQSLNVQYGHISLDNFNDHLKAHRKIIALSVKSIVKAGELISEHNSRNKSNEEVPKDHQTTLMISSISTINHNTELKSPHRPTAMEALAFDKVQESQALQ